MLRQMHVLSKVLFAVLVPKCPNVKFSTPFEIAGILVRVEKLCTLIGALVNLQNTLSYETKFFTYGRSFLNVDIIVV